MSFKHVFKSIGKTLKQITFAENQCRFLFHNFKFRNEKFNASVCFITNNINRV